MAVGDYCRRDPVTVSPDDSVRDAAQRMEAAGVGSVVVVDEARRPVGVLTDRDVVVRVLRRRRDANGTRVADVVGSEVSVVREGAPLLTALRRMRSDGVRRVPVVDEDGRLIGIISVDDVIQLLASELSDVAQAVRSQFPADLAAAHSLASRAES